MKIETLDDWNLVLGGCCDCTMPGFPVPLVVGDYKTGVGWTRAEAMTSLGQQPWMPDQIGGFPITISHWLRNQDSGNPGWPRDHVVATRFKWQVNPEWPGSYFKISWDLWHNTRDIAPYLQSGGTWEWSGPGDPQVPDSWLSGYYYLDPPTEAGEIVVCNLRFLGYRSARVGAKPLCYGPAYP